eukprot:13536094-Alexandrium_andersonii.AAC.1
MPGLLTPTSQGLPAGNPCFKDSQEVLHLGVELIREGVGRVLARKGPREDDDRLAPGVLPAS